jgi:hypothetical protein
MAWPKGTPRPEGAGRKKGTPNKITADIKALAQEHGATAITILATILTTAESDQAKIAAAKELLDRGYGKATQQVIGAGEDGEHLIDASLNVTFVSPDGD